MKVTTGIQSQDLLGRKVTMVKGKALQLLAERIQGDIKTAMADEELAPYAQKLGANLASIQQVLGFLMPHAMKGDYERYLSDATIFMDLFGTTINGMAMVKNGY